MPTRSRYGFDDEDDDEFQRTLSNLVNQRDDDDDDDDDDVEVGGAPSEAASHVHFAPAEARPFLAEVAPPESTAALPVPTGIGRTAQDVLRQTAPAAGSARRLAPSRLGSLLSGSSRSVVDEDKPWNDDRAFIPCGLGHVVFEGLNCFAALVCTGLLGWLVINQILTGCPGFLGSFEFKVDKEGTPLGPFEC